MTTLQKTDIYTFFTIRTRFVEFKKVTNDTTLNISGKLGSLLQNVIKCSTMYHL
jgi:hypothetical protein